MIGKGRGKARVLGLVGWMKAVVVEGMDDMSSDMPMRGMICKTSMFTCMLTMDGLLKSTECERFGIREGEKT